MFLFRLSRQGLHRIRVSTLTILILLGLCLSLGATAWGNPSLSRAQEPSVNTTLSDQATSAKPTIRFLEVSEALYSAVIKGDLVVAMNRLKETERLFRALPMENIVTAEGIQALASNITDLKRAAAAVSPDEEKWERGAAALRLSADTLAHPDHPIWHQYQSILLRDVAELDNQLEQEAVKREEGYANALIVFQKLTQHYQLIRTSVIMQSETWKVERSDSVIRYAERVLSAAYPSQIHLSNISSQLTEALKGLFPPSEEAEITFVPPIAGPPWAWSATIGSFIVIILTWVGWIRYRAEPYVLSGKSSKRSKPREGADDLHARWIK